MMATIDVDGVAAMTNVGMMMMMMLTMTMMMRRSSETGAFLSYSYILVRNFRPPAPPALMLSLLRSL